MARLPLFEKSADYVAFKAVLAQTHERFSMRIPSHYSLSREFTALHGTQLSNRIR